MFKSVRSVEMFNLFPHSLTRRYSKGVSLKISFTKQFILRNFFRLKRKKEGNGFVDAPHDAVGR